MENEQPSPTPQIYVSAPQMDQQKRKGGLKKALLILLILLLLGGAGFLGYTYKITNDNLKKKSQDLSNAYNTIQKFQTIINNDEAKNNFIAKYNDKNLSRSSCSNQAVGMFDVHINDKFAVYRYLCASSSYSAPIRIAAFKKLSDGSYEFTYGASTIKPNGLPDYIYNSEPEFFGRVYGATKF